MVVGGAPLARTTSMSSCAGYHTPIEDEVAGDLPLDLRRGQSLLSTQAPSPMSAVLTVSLDGYLDPQHLSYGSPPASEPQRLCSEESYFVFSPLPSVSYDHLLNFLLNLLTIKLGSGITSTNSKAEHTNANWYIKYFATWY